MFIACLTSTVQAQTVGTFTNTPEALNAYTLFSVTFGTESYIIDNCGEKVNEWSHLNQAGLAAYLLDDGRLLRSAKISHPRISQPSQGGVIEIYTWDGDIEWQYNFNTDFRTQHHELEYLPNGNVLFLAWEWLSQSEVRELGRDVNEHRLRPLYSEAIYEVMPTGPTTGEIVWEWHLTDHIVQDFDSTMPNYVTAIDDHPRKLDFNFQGFNNWSDTDWFHSNALDYNAERDEILVNCRNVNEIWIIDHSTSSSEAASSTGGDRGFGGDFLFRWGSPSAYDRGTNDDIKLYGSHGVEWIPQDRKFGGSIIAFNNGIKRPGGDRSTIEIITPEIDQNGDYVIGMNGRFQPEDPEMTFDPSFFNNAPGTFYSPYQSNTSILPNGHLFTNRGENGHFVEYDSMNQIVWDYVSPVGASGPVEQGEIPSISSVFVATRLPVDHPAFDGKDLTPQGVIELNPGTTNCEIFSSLENNNPDRSFQIYYYDNQITIKRPESDINELNLSLSDIHGRLILNSSIQQGVENVLLPYLISGIYVATIVEDNKSIYTTKIFIP